MFTNLPPLSLYVHMPWCKKKCPYCDFNSYVDKNSNSSTKETYIKKLIQDFSNDIKYVEGRKIESIYFGGGTPNLFSPAMYNTLLKKINNFVEFAPNIEISMEANPGIIGGHNFQDYKHAGITRISLGAQSFDDQKLLSLGRIHTKDDIIKAVLEIQKAKFNNFNIDIMYGLLNQTIDDALKDLETAIALQPTHISWYNLTIEKGTKFYDSPPKLPNMDYLFNMAMHGQKLLLNNNFIRYEVSGYSKNFFQCIHNLNYWQYGDYIGIGAASHSKITTNNNKIIRYQKAKHPDDYMNKGTDFITKFNTLSPQDIIFEFMLNNLRLEDGFSIDFFTERTGLGYHNIAKSLKVALDKELIMLLNNRIKPTKLGKKFLNNLCEIFLPN